MSNEIISAENKVVEKIEETTEAIQNVNNIIDAAKKCYDEITKIIHVAKEAVLKLGKVLRLYYWSKITQLEKELYLLPYKPENNVTDEQASYFLKRATKIRIKVEKYNKKIEKADKEAAAIIYLSLTAIAGIIATAVIKTKK